MGLGGCIILIAVGAILTFATDWHMEGVNLDLVGVILMLVGLIGVTTFSSIARRRRVVVPPSAPVIDEERHHSRRDGYSDGYGV
jgi:predicted CDP-diglyceride synthetase/phosphatidate cytidylyltransferase